MHERKPRNGESERPIDEGAYQVPVTAASTPTAEGLPLEVGQLHAHLDRTLSNHLAEGPVQIQESQLVGNHEPFAAPTDLPPHDVTAERSDELARIHERAIRVVSMRQLRHCV